MNKIYIPTFRRVESQITFDSLPDKYKEKTILVIQEHERPLHKHDVEYLIVGDNIGIAKTRKEIIYHAGKSRFCLYDDDVKFYRRNIKYTGQESDIEGSKRLMNEKDFDEMFDLFNSWMDDENIIQIGHRTAFLPPQNNKYKDITSIYQCSMIAGEKVFKFRDEVDWTYVQFGSDTMMSIEFLLRGYKNRQSDIFVCQGKWWQEGGCSVNRNADAYNKEHKKLLKKYPEYVYISGEKEYQNIGKILNFKYRWKKAYNSFYDNSLSNFFE